MLKSSKDFDNFLEDVEDNVDNTKSSRGNRKPVDIVISVQDISRGNIYGATIKLVGIFEKGKEKQMRDLKHGNEKLFVLQDVSLDDISGESIFEIAHFKNEPVLRILEPGYIRSISKEGTNPKVISQGE